MKSLLLPILICKNRKEQCAALEILIKAGMIMPLPYTKQNLEEFLDIRYGTGIAVSIRINAANNTVLNPAYNSEVILRLKEGRNVLVNSAYHMISHLKRVNII